MKEINSMDFPQHGEVFYFYGQALYIDIMTAISVGPTFAVSADSKTLLSDWTLCTLLLLGNKGVSGRLRNLRQNKDLSDIDLEMQLCPFTIEGAIYGWTTGRFLTSQHNSQLKVYLHSTSFSYPYPKWGRFNIFFIMS
jgi:hypothetical protein